MQKKKPTTPSGEHQTISCQPGQPDGDVCSAVEEMATCIRALSQDVANLQDHLTPVMISAKDEPYDESAEPANPGITPVSNTLFIQIAELRALRARVRTIQNLVAL